MARQTYQLNKITILLKGVCCSQLPLSSMSPRESGVGLARLSWTSAGSCAAFRLGAQLPGVARGHVSRGLGSGVGCRSE